ncbi:3-ketoacyl-CoA synthase 15-like [Andrographis paniculata]|uniref:3-ketoacyl-CoA synthase 15-like n=1 Tax=Andrographis paniculata TaxID=175694 RepID=UPI0021E6F90D|nr:3-ketoacyl-CoA synthase 15-like [Andrographis paniculata]
MARNEHLSTKIVIKESGPDAGSRPFSVRALHGFPDFLSLNNLKYVKIGYVYLINFCIYFMGASSLLLAFGTKFGKLTLNIFFMKYFNSTNIVLFFGVLAVLVYVLFNLAPTVTYLIDFACYVPPEKFKITKEEYIELAKKSGQFNDESLKFQRRVLNTSGIGDATYLPRAVFRPGYAADFHGGREEAAMLMYGAVDNLLAATALRLNDVRILIVNCGVFNATPSLSAMIVNHYKLNHRIRTYNLGGMGGAAGVAAVDLANNLLKAYPPSYALIVSTEVLRYTWYAGGDSDMILPNCFLRLGAAAVLLSNRRRDRWRCKYQLKQLVRTHKHTDDRSYRSIYLREDSGGRRGLSVSKDMIELAGDALKANIKSLNSLVLPISERFHFFKSLIFRKSSDKPAFEHICILATSKKVLDRIQEDLDLADEFMEASRKTLERFGNSSSSSIWYELAYLEAQNRINNGDRVWQLALGSGLDCNSVFWKAVRNVREVKRNPWERD